MALSYCAARKLDPFKRPVHIVPMWDSQRREMVETVWPGISEIRTTAFRTSQYAGCDEVEFGPMRTETFTGKVGRRGNEEDKSVTVTFPEWGRINVYRILNGQRCKFVSPKVYWLESYGRQGASDVPNDMWAKRPSGQLEKCVEAAGLRKAFPEEIGNDYSAEEMAGQVLTVDTPAAERAIAPPPPVEVQASIAAPTPATGPQPPPQPEAEEAVFTEAAAPAGTEQKQASTKEAGKPAAPAEQEAEANTFDVTAFLQEVEETFTTCRTESDVDEAHEGFADRVEGYLARNQRDRYADLHADALKRVGGQDSPPAETKTEAAPPPPPADDEDDDFPVPVPPPAEIYAGKLRAALANCTDAAEPGEIWGQSRAERKTMEDAGEMTVEFRKELHGEVMAIYKRLVEQQGRPERPAETAKTDAKPEQPAGAGDQGEADDSEVAKFTDDFRARLEAAADTNALNNLIAETQERRDDLLAKYPAAAAAFRPMIQRARKKLAGV